MRINGIKVGAISTVALCGFTTASADSLTFSASAGNLAASAAFETSGTDLIVRLSNTSLFDVMVPADILTAVFFEVNCEPLNLTPASAVLNAGSTVLFGGTDAGGVVGGEWEWEESFSGPAPHGADYGISSSGYGLFGSGEMFPGTNLQGPDGVNGLQYGITSAGDDPATGNTPVAGTNGLIRNSVVFTLSGLPAEFDINCITNVNWQYGTSLTEPNIPEPTTALLLGAGACALIRRRR